MSTEAKVTKMAAERVPLSLLNLVDGLNLRKDYGDIKGLAESIKENGILIPLLGTVDDGVYNVVAGHRRFKAAQLVKQETGEEMYVPFLRLPRGTNAEQIVIDMFIENDGKPLSPVEQSEGVSRLINAGWAEKDIAKKTGKSVTYITNLAYLHNAPKKVKTMVEKNIVSATQVMYAMKNNELNDKWIEKVERIAEKMDAGEKDGTGKKSAKNKAARVTSKDLHVNSIQEFKRFVKNHDESTFANKTVEEHYWLLSDFINGALDYEDITNYFLNGVYPTAKESGTPTKTKTKKVKNAKKSKAQRQQELTGAIDNETGETEKVA